MRTDVQIASGVESWVQQELDLASQTVNRLYNDYDSIIEGFGFPVEDPRNTAASKALSHTGRFMNTGVWYTPFESEPQDEGAAAKMLFACLMRVSGARKNVGYTHCSDQEAFDEFIRDGRNFSSARLIIAQEMAQVSDPLDFSRLRKINDRTIETHEQLFCRIRLEGGSFSPDARAAAKEFEQDTLRTLTNYVMFSAAARNGDIANVPALEPKSISLDPEIIYPFAA